MRILAVFFIITGMNLVSGSANLHINITAHLAKLFHQKKADVQKYILQSFRQYQLQVEWQYYCVQENHHSNHCEIEAKNIIGTAGMHTQTTGPVLVVGTAYNTDGQEDPYYNSGEVAVMLEVARIFMSSTSGKPRFPITFVAFDFGSKECWTGEGRLPGGWIFVQDWLLPRLQYTSYKFEGAIILGPVMNINSEGNRTNVQLKETFPSLNEQVQFKRNSLALISHPTNSRLSVEGFRKFPFLLDHLQTTEKDYREIFCQLPIREAQHFWGATRNNIPHPLSAVVLTDLEHSHMKPRGGETTKLALDVAERTVKGINDFLLTYHADVFEDYMSLSLLVLAVVNTFLFMVVVALIVSDNLKNRN